MNHSSIPCGYQSKLNGKFKQFFYSEGGSIWSDIKWKLLVHYNYILCNLTAEGMTMDINPDYID
mgnify:CR=1 FL=1